LEKDLYRIENGSKVILLCHSFTLKVKLLLKVGFLQNPILKAVELEREILESNVEL